MWAGCRKITKEIIAELFPDLGRVRRNGGREWLLKPGRIKYGEDHLERSCEHWFKDTGGSLETSQERILE